MKKWIGLLLIFLVAILAIGSVNAADLETHNFDNYFSMKIPKDVNFVKEENFSEENGFYSNSVIYTNDELMVMYFDSPIYSENSSTSFLQVMFESVYPDLSECYEEQEDNLIILQPKTIDDTHFPMVGLNSGNEMVILLSKDLGLLKEMGQSIEFN